MDIVDPPYGGGVVEVPLLTSAVVELSDDEWMQYRERSSYVDMNSGRLDITLSQHQIARCVQEWLYLGLLAVLSNNDIEGRDFSSPGKGWCTVIDSRQVRSTIINMQVRLLRLSGQKRENAFQRQNNILVAADEAARWVESQFAERSDALVDLIVLSVRILIETIYRVHNDANGSKFCKLSPTSRATADLEGHLSTAADRALESLMLENGWCIHQIHKVLSSFSYQTSYYLANLPRPESAKLVHDTCTRGSCRGWNSKPGRTSARHATEGCACATVRVSSLDITRIIQGGDIPLVSIEEDPDGSMTLKLHTKQWYVKLYLCNSIQLSGSTLIKED